MQTILDFSITTGYKSNSQIARKVTEYWMEKYMFCPRCGNIRLMHFENNKPVVDFFCEKCSSEYELKSKNGSINNKITDGAYSTMIERITSNNNPDFFFMSYSLSEKIVKNLIVVPKALFTPSIIEKRKPLDESAKRAGWVGCNILLSGVPEQGRITIINEKGVVDREKVVRKFRTAEKLTNTNIEARGWLLDVLLCVNSIKENEFSLNEIYKFEEILYQKHPANNNILPKIRQQLQSLRDKGFIEFLGNGRYRKLLTN